MAKVSMVAAMASNRALGKDNKLLWHISEDLKHFKAITRSEERRVGKECP